jgi:hypothetical protein
MSCFKKVEETKSGLKILGFGESGSGKTIFALSFPESAAVDAEDGMGHYKKKYPNLKYIFNTTSAEDVEDALEEIEESLCNEIKTFIVDSETKIYENLQLGGLNVAEKRARLKAQSVDDAAMSQREWGKLKLISKRIQATKLMLASKGINIISIAQQKDIKEKKGDNWITVGHAPDTAKAFEYDYDIVIRFYTIKNDKNEDEYKGEILKDRTQTFKRGAIIDNPSFDNWKSVYDYKAGLKEEVINFTGDIKKDEDKMNSELEKMEKIIKEFKALMKSLSKENQLKAQNKLKEHGIDNPLHTDDFDGMLDVIEFLKAMA